MALYEHIYLARQDVSAQQVEELTNTYTELIASDGGQVTKYEYWGLKSLSYRIKKNRKAHYTLMNIDAPHDAVAEMERQMGTFRRHPAVHDHSRRCARRRPLGHDAEARRRAATAATAATARAASSADQET